MLCTDMVTYGSRGEQYSSVTKQHYTNVWKELPAAWREGLNVKTMLASTKYVPSVNKHGVGCGNKLNKADEFGLDAWEDAGWIDPQDPYGWIQWHCN